MEKKIIYGNDNFGYALIDTSEETPKFSAPVMLPGMISSKIEVEESSTKIAADNTTFAIIAGAKVRSAEAAVTYIPVQYYTECLGYYYSFVTGGKFKISINRKYYDTVWTGYELNLDENSALEKATMTFGKVRTKASERYFQ